MPKYFFIKKLYKINAIYIRMVMVPFLKYANLLEDFRKLLKIANLQELRSQAK